MTAASLLDARPEAPPRPLSAGHFRRIAEAGFGDGHNSYPFSYAWYGEHLYVGTNRDAIPIIMLRSAFDLPFEQAPVPTPAPENWRDLDLRAEIWRYDPQTETWERVYRAPLVRGYQGMMIPQAVGFRCMSVFQGSSDPKPAIYTIPVVGRNAPGTVVLRCIDGRNFESLGPPRVLGKDDDYGSYRALCGFKGYLFAAPAAAKPPPTANAPGERFISLLTTAEGSAVRCSADPGSGEWQLSSESSFGDPTNISIVDMVVCGDHLYAGTMNACHGFQVWRTDAEGPPPHRWEKVMDRGADRGPLNEAVLSMAEFRGDLHIGTCIQNGGYDRLNKIGPAAAEVLRLRADGSWDLLVGAPRQTRQGLKVPLSGFGPGFQNQFGVYMWRMCSHDGALYVGTHDLSSFVPFTDPKNWPERVRKIFSDEILDRFLELRGGAELWRTTDGENWVPITINGFDNFYNYGIRTLLSTPRGLFVGTANPFGPKVAVRGPHGWSYQDNPRGGLEIWHGHPEHAGRGYSDGALGARPPRPLGNALRSEGPSVGSELDAETAALHSLYGAAEVFWRACRPDPLLGLALVDKDLVLARETVEEELAFYFGDSELRCAGLWEREGATPQEAAEALVDTLLAMLEGDGEAGPRTVLAVGGGVAGVVPRLLELHPSDTIYALAQGPEEAARARRRLDVPVEVFDGETLPFLSASCDAIVWIEGPGRGDRAQGFAEVRRVLRPGGVLVASELVRSAGGDADPAIFDTASAVKACEQDLLLAKLVPRTLADNTRKGWRRFFHHSRSYGAAKLLFHHMDAERHSEFLAALPGGEAGVVANVLLCATRLEGGARR